MWTLPLPPKLKHFLWHTCHDILPTSHNLFKRKVLPSPTCSRCLYHDETLEHALFRCPALQESVSLLSKENDPTILSYHLRLSVDATQDVHLNKMGFRMAMHAHHGEVLLNWAMP
ncbi:hypothetical protein G4B88_018067 [Cannabis sativa]|uniref:Reverse transcriptase zinc-binding domain-containing protein n=1 Tax=Cannabis sativa TaxID=3483 RepID=A0A7J6FTU5_CANSA|nr:hypothetical protein G4B88_018067 [Cannabis sativa]